MKPGRRFFERALAERVRAGGPEQAPDAVTEAITIDRYLIDHPSRTSLVRVKGDSMTRAGILGGDLAVVEWRSDARVGDIVVAILDEELTLKYLDRDKRGYFLRGCARPLAPRPRGSPAP